MHLPCKDTKLTSPNHFADNAAASPIVTINEEPSLLDSRQCVAELLDSWTV